MRAVARSDPTRALSRRPSHQGEGVRRASPLAALDPPHSCEEGGRAPTRGAPTSFPHRGLGGSCLRRNDGGRGFAAQALSPPLSRRPSPSGGRGLDARFARQTPPARCRALPSPHLWGGWEGAHEGRPYVFPHCRLRDSCLRRNDGGRGFAARALSPPLSRRPSHSCGEGGRAPTRGAPTLFPHRRLGGSCLRRNDGGRGFAARALSPPLSRRPSPLVWGGWEIPAKAGMTGDSW